MEVYDGIANKISLCNHNICMACLDALSNTTNQLKCPLCNQNFKNSDVQIDQKLSEEMAYK